MELEITDKKTIKQIQDAFNTAYPFLWIDFFHVPTIVLDHARPEKIKPETFVKNVYPFAGTKSINIEGSRSVAQLEEDFWKNLRLKVQVLRRLGNVWVGTSYTGNWTLENQNSEGQQIDMSK